MPSILTPAQRDEFERDGYVIVRGLFDGEEIALLREAIERDPAIRSHFYDRFDAAGKSTRMALWNHPGDGVYGLAARSARIVDTMADLLGGEVYHYHSKLTAKEPREGGAWEWHQDYGYWYYNGALAPRLFSTMIALDRSDRANGCLQVVRGSHALGRIDHVPLTPGQNEADPARMKHILARHEIVHAELDPGDVLFFHCNTLHRSDANRSPNRRWTLLICYNAADNDTIVRDHDRFYVRLDKVPDAAIKRAGLRFAAGGGDEHFTSKPFVPEVAPAGTRKAS
jgi:hypothetical protein